jgi:hypothetical protein
MPTCIRCQGEGFECYEDDGRDQCDTCYHCGGSGQVDEETHRSDMLESVAESMAWIAANEYAKACDSDPDGDGFCLHAAENGYSPSDYIKILAYDRISMFLDKLMKESVEEQNEFIRKLEANERIEPLPYHFFE